MTVTDQYGCSDDTTVTVEEPDVLVANTTAQDSVSCNGLFDGSASVTAIGGNLVYTYQWDLACRRTSWRYGYEFRSWNVYGDGYGSVWM